MIDVYANMEKSWQAAREGFILECRQDYSAFVDENLDAILLPAGFVPHTLFEGMGCVSLNIQRIATGEIMDEYDLEVYDPDAYQELNTFLQNVQGAICDHDPFPAEYSGRYLEQR